MIKKIVVLILVLFSYAVGIAQSVTARSSSVVTVMDSRLFAQYNFRPPVFPDTTAANVQKGLDSCGALIFTYDYNGYWYRACSPKRWIKVGASLGGDTAYVSSRQLTPNTFVLCRGDGRCDTISIATQGVTRLVSGSAVWTSGLNYDVTNCVYYILGTLYNSLATTVTLDPADPSNPRIDVIYLDTLGNVGVITGTPSPDPIKPVVNPLSQIELTHVYLNAGSISPPNVYNRLVYNEGVGVPTEWNIPVASETIDYYYTPNPYVGSVSAYNSQSGIGNDYDFINNTSVNADTISLLTMHIRPNGTMTDVGKGLFYVLLYKADNPVSNYVLISDGTYGFNQSLLNQYQLVSIPMTDFYFDNPLDKTFDEIKIIVGADIVNGVQFDYINLQSGSAVPPVTSNYWSLSGNDVSSVTSPKLGTTSNNSLSIVTNDIERINISDTGLVKITNLQTSTSQDTTTNKPVGVNSNGELIRMNDWATGTIYAENPIMATVRNDSNIIYFNADTANAWRSGGGWTTNGTTALTGNVLIQNSNHSLSFGGAEEDMTTFSAQANLIQFSPTGIGFQIVGLDHTSDTTTYKPLGYDSNTGFVYKMDNWAGGGVPNLEQVLTAGNTSENDLGIILYESNAHDKTVIISPEIGFTYDNEQAGGDVAELNGNGLRLRTNLAISSDINSVDLNVDGLTYYKHIDAQNSNYTGSILSPNSFPNDTTITANFYLPLSNGTQSEDTIATLRDIRGNTSGGTVTSISQGYGISNSPTTITTTGTISVDTATLSGKYLRIVDTTNKWVNRITRTPGKDSIIYYIDGNRYAIKDSVGGGSSQNGRFGNDTATIVMAKVHNDAGVTLTNGNVVRWSSSGTNSDAPSVRLANSKADSSSANTVGFVSGTINANDTGWVILSGKIEKLNTSAFSNGDIIYLDTISGGWTKSKPSAPVHLVYLGVVVKANAGNGSIFVKCQNGYELDEIHDVKITSPLNNQVLVYSDTQKLWKNRNIYSVVDTVNTIATKSNVALKLNISDTAAMLSKYLRKTDTASLSSRINVVSKNSFGGSWDGQGGTVTTGNTIYKVMPYGGTITGWSIAATGTSPTCTIDVWKIAAGTALPTVANTITASAKPALATGNVIRSTTLTGWTTTFSAGDIFAINVDASLSATKIYFTVEFNMQ